MMFVTQCRSITSRHICNNVFEDRTTASNYQRHRNRLDKIQTRTTEKLKEPQHLVVSRSLNKFKLISRNSTFKKTKDERRLENYSLLGRLNSIYEPKKPVQPSLAKSQKLVSSRVQDAKKMNQRILEENLVLLRTIQQSLDNYRSKKEITK